MTTISRSIDRHKGVVGAVLAPATLAAGTPGVPCSAERGLAIATGGNALMYGAFCSVRGLREGSRRASSVPGARERDLAGDDGVHRGVRLAASRRFRIARAVIAVRYSIRRLPISTVLSIGPSSTPFIE